MSANNQPVVLIVDDDPVQRLLVRGSLEAAGFQCEEAEDGLAMRRVLEGSSIDLVILDLNLPGENGTRSSVWNWAPTTMFRSPAISDT
jgi:DNA-binding response OmpR family regulator